MGWVVDDIRQQGDKKIIFIDLELIYSQDLRQGAVHRAGAAENSVVWPVHRAARTTAS